MKFFKEPFWPVTIISSILNVLLLMVLFVIYWQVEDWHYLTLAALVGVLLAAHML